MAVSHATQAQKIRASLKHPVIDVDGHIIELTPVLLDFIRKVGGSHMVDRYLEGDGSISWWRMSPQERRDTRTTIKPWWGSPTNTLDRATATLPRLMRDRLDDLGIDFTVLYPSAGLYAVTFPGIRDNEMRQVVCRALNTYMAEVYGEYPERMAPAALIPMGTPDEAIAEIEHAVNALGIKVVGIGCDVSRPVPQLHREHPGLGEAGSWRDTFGLDSEYDYDRVWEKCVELKVAVTGHGSSQGFGHRTSISNYMHNHIGGFAAAGEALCKAVFMAGVTRRFPTLNFAFLEGGVVWACALFSDLLGHWEKRNGQAILRLDPATLNHERLMTYFRDYGFDEANGKLDAIRESLVREQPRPEVLDDWAACDIQTAEDLRDLFVPRFYFGCEADDPLNALAFNTSMDPFGARLGALFSSDMGHWDVPDMEAILPEAYELVEKGLLTEEDFRDFAFGNSVRLHGGMNPEFFVGTKVEEAAGSLLRAEGA